MRCEGKCRWLRTGNTQPGCSDVDDSFAKLRQLRSVATPPDGNGNDDYHMVGEYPPHYCDIDNQKILCSKHI